MNLWLPPPLLLLLILSLGRLPPPTVFLPLLLLSSRLLRLFCPTVVHQEGELLVNDQSVAKLRQNRESEGEEGGRGTPLQGC
jgi:hypothetical protein